MAPNLELGLALLAIILGVAGLPLIRGSRGLSGLERLRPRHPDETEDRDDG